MRRTHLGPALTLLLACAAPPVAPGPIARVERVVERGGHLDWCAKTDVVAFDRRGPSGYFDVWLMNPDGSGQRPLSERIPGLPRRHVGMPAWHPGCDVLAIQVQQPGAPRAYDDKSVPGAGVFNDLWIAKTDGSRAWKVVAVSGEVSKDAEGILHPHFSHDGRRLVWTQRIGAGGGAFGAWVIQLADFAIGADGEPRVTNVQRLVPGGTPTFFEAHGFSPDDRKLLYSSTQDTGLEIYTLELATGAVERLTQSPRVWDEHAHYAPDGRAIAWISSEGLRFRRWPFVLETDFWLMDASGANPRQLTYFHQRGHPHYVDEDFVVAADSAWSPDGKSLLGLVITGRPGTERRGEGPIYRIELP